MIAHEKDQLDALRQHFANATDLERGTDSEAYHWCEIARIVALFKADRLQELRHRVQAEERNRYAR